MTSKDMAAAMMVRGQKRLQSNANAMAADHGWMQLNLTFKSPRVIIPGVSLALALALALALPHRL